MKTIKSIGLSITMLMASMIPGISGTTTSTQDQSNTPIIIINNSTEPEDAPRSNNPFFAELSDGYVLLGASTTCGTVSVRITSTAGDDFNTYFDTSSGVIILPVSGNTGSYLLSITTSGGTHYIGEFTI